MNSVSPTSALVTRIADGFRALPIVEAVVLSGSRTSQVDDQYSDMDFYVYASAEIPLGVRRQVAAGAVHMEMDNNFWEPGDEWVDAAGGISVDIMFRDVHWIEEQLDRVLRDHRPSLGYSTCFWYNVLHSRALFDRSGWFERLQRYANQPYPAELQRAIIAKNHPILRHNISSYLHQIELAIARNDAVSVHHRASALLASYFDIIFAVNEQPHPGEKRLVQYATTMCAKLPPGMEIHVAALLRSLSDMNASVVANVNSLLDGLDDLLLSARLALGMN